VERAGRRRLNVRLSRESGRIIIGDVLARCQQLDERRPRLPASRRMAHGRGIEIQKSHENLADNARADRAESISVTADVGLPQDVVPSVQKNSFGGKRWQLRKQA
jgi:hypothetical protein